MTANKQTPAWAHVIKVGGVDAEGRPATATRCKHCNHTPSASAWRFALCPKCGYRGGEVKNHTTVPRGGYPETPIAPVAPRVAPVAPVVDTPMTDGEREFAKRIQDLIRQTKGGN